MSRVRWGLAVFLVAAGPGAAGLGAQSALDRSPNMEGVWAARPGTIHFHFLHRFQVTDPPARKVLNTPTFLLATGVGGGAMVGARYASNSTLVSADSWDGELLVGRDLGPLRVLVGGRAFSAFAAGDAAWAVAGGARLRLTRHVALAGDMAELIDRPDGLDRAWSAGLQLEIPYTPHSLSLHASNSNTTTLQGSSVGRGDRQYGFEFTIPITLRRYFGGREPATAATTERAAAPGAAAGASGAPAAAVVVEMDNRLRYLPDTVRVRVGETVRWRNTSDVLHTVTADGDRAVRATSVVLPAGASPFDSGDLAPGEEYSHTFTVEGEYRYFCIPHELAGMVGTVIVEGGG